MVVFVRTLVLYVVVVAVMRIMGKRQIGELQPFELVIAIMLSELAAVPMQDTGIPLIHGLIPILTLMFLEILLSYITLKSRSIRKVICGTACVLIKHGQIIENELRRQRFNLDDLMEELRLSGYLNISDIEYALLENSGKLSIIPKSNSSPVKREDLKISHAEEELPISIILDGKLIDNNLKKIGKNEQWLFKKLKENNIKKIEDTFIAMIDSNKNFFAQGGPTMTSDLKKLLFSIAIIVMVIFSGILIKGYLYSSSSKLLKQISSIEEDIHKNNWTNAIKTSYILYNNWNKTEKIWTVFTNHHEIDNITITLTNSLEYIKTQNKSDSLAALSSLKHYIKHIPDMERLILKNIF